MKVGFISLGCAKNQVNCEQMIWQTYEAGYEVALGAAGCDVAVVNTCGFLQEAREEALAEIQKLVEQKQAGQLQKILVTGCMAQMFGEEVRRELPEVMNSPLLSFAQSMTLRQVLSLAGNIPQEKRDRILAALKEA